MTSSPFFLQTMSQLRFPVYSSLFVANTILALALGIISWQRRARGSQMFAIVMLSVAIWSFGRLFEGASQGLEEKIFWAKVEYIGVSSVTVLWMLFSMMYARMEAWFTRRNLILVWVIPVLTLLAAWTNESHHLIWTSIARSPADLNILIYSHGAWFWVSVAYNYVIGLIGTIILFHTVIHAHQLYRIQVGLLVSTTLLPLVGNLIYLFGLSPVPGLDLTPFTFTLAGVLFAISLLSFNLFDLVPAARDVLVDMLLDGVLVLDERERVIDINLAGQKMLAASSRIIGQPASTALVCWQQLTIVREKARIAPVEVSLVHPGGTIQQVDLAVLPIYRSKGWTSGTLFFLRDITRRRRAELALQDLNASLDDQVATKTAQLRSSLDELEKEVTERKRVEAVLQESRQNLVQRVADQSQKLAALYEVILAGGQTSSVEEMLDQTVSRIASALKGQAATIHQWDEKRSSLTLAASWGLSAETRAQLLSLPKECLPEEHIPLSSSDPVQNKLLSLASPYGFRASMSGLISFQGQHQGVVSIFWMMPQTFQVEDIALFSLMADQLGLILENIRLRVRIEQAAILKERRRLARDLHDSVTQSLHSLVLTSDTARNRLRLGNTERLDSSLEQLAESARQALKEMRLLLYELRLASIQDLDLVDAIGTRLEAVEQRAGVEVKLDVDGGLGWSKAWKAEIYSIVMEALNNSLKHARATKVSVALRGGSNWVEMNIDDNGCGFDPASERVGIGLKSMAERAEKLGGELEINSTKGNGTHIHLKVGRGVY